MAASDCIMQYEQLSKRIFEKRHLRVKVTHGLAPALYSGKGLRDCVRTLLADCQLDEDFSIRHDVDVMAW